MKKRIFSLIISITTIILEALPHSAVITSATSADLENKEALSYFSTKLFVYANFAPFITAVLSCIIFLLALLNLIKLRENTSILLFVISILAFLVSVYPIIQGLKLFSVASVLISITLFIQIFISMSNIRKSNEV